MRLRLAVLGDSIGAGHGASQPQDRLARRLGKGLRDAGFDAGARVFALAGSRSSALAPQVDKALEWEPHLAVIVIGANDVTHRTPPHEAAEALGDAVRRLREIEVEVVVAPAPDLSAVPQVPSFLSGAVHAASEKLRNAQVAAATAAGAVVADADGLTSRLFQEDSALFSGDRFHPSSAGYAVIAGELLPHLLVAAKTVTERDTPPET